ncbi:MAG: LPS export ABC transporter permease LptG [Cycloclasticus sp. symbiont of Poecilosclerida sp. M]|nr:MAG: LPS export ABC transporter permease LptG [Cycloclasticus sp. symbiont of Poecilosclerida sp. M]
MEVINRYIAVEMFKSTGIALVSLLTLVLVFTFADELGDLGEGQYDIVKIFQYLALIAPRNFHELIPAAAILGALVTLGSMANNFELTAMRAAGVSRWQIIFSVLRAGVLMMAVSLFVSEVIAPSTEQAAQMLKFTAKNEQIALRTKFGFWARDGNTYLNIREITNSSELKDVSIYEMTEDNAMKYATQAARASFSGNKWQLEDIKRTDFSGEGVKVTLSETAVLDSLLDPEILDVVVVKPNRLSIIGLARYITFLEENGQNASRYMLAMTGKLIRPLLILTMLLISIPFVLNIHQTSSLGFRILVGALIGISFNLIDKLFGNLGIVYGLHPVISASLPFLVVTGASVWAIRRMD